MSALQFYQENTAMMVIPYSAGGGVDYAGRVFASFWGDVVGGNMRAQNKTGGGGVAGVNFVWDAKPDGLTMATGIKGSVVSQQAFQESGMKWDIAKFNWIGMFARETNVVQLSAKTQANTIQDLRNMKEVKFGITNPRSSSGISTGIIIDLLGLTNAKIIAGYGGVSEVDLALGRGEIDAGIAQAPQARDNIGKGWGKVPLILFSEERMPEWPDSPTIGEVINVTTPEQQSFVDVLLGYQASRVWMLPPGVPQDRVQFVRETFDKIVANKGFQDQVSRIIMGSLFPVKGDQTYANLKKLYDGLSGDTIVRIDQLMEKYTAK